MADILYLNGWRDEDSVYLTADSLICLYVIQVACAESANVDVVLVKTNHLTKEETPCKFRISASLLNIQGKGDSSRLGII